MTESSPSTDRKALIAALAEQARSAAPEKSVPEPEVLLDYLAGRLTPEDEQRIARQLVADPEMARALLDLAELEAAGAEAGEHPTDLAAMAGWRELRGRLRGLSRGSWRPPRFWPLLPAAAASLLASTLGLGSWVVRLQSQLKSPIPNVASRELKEIRGDQVIELPPGDPLRLSFDDPNPLAKSCPGYTAEVEGRRSGYRETVEPLRRNKGKLALVILLNPGSYTLRLLGCEPTHKLIQEYDFTIVPPLEEGRPEG